MPKTEKKFKESFNIRIEKEEKKRWEQFTKDNNYASVSHMIRTIVDERITGILAPAQQNNELSNRLKALEIENKELLKSQNEILKLIAQKSTVQTNTKLSGYQKEVILNLLREKSRNEKELANLLDREEIEIMTLLNDLLEMGLIKRSEKNKTKFEVVV